MRNQKGYSLVFVASMGLIMVMMALAVTAGLIPVYRNIGSQNLVTQSQAAAEVGMQYALQQLNAASDPNDVTSPAVPVSLTNAQVNITVEQVDNNSLKSTPFYDAATIASGFPVDTRRITSQAIYGLTKATIICGVQKVSRSGFNPALTSAQLEGMIPKTYFNNALFGASSVLLDNTDNNGLPLLSTQRLSVLSANRTAQIGSNQNIKFVGNTVVEGNVIANNSVAAATSIAGSSTNIIKGNLTYNGNMTTDVISGAPSFIPDTIANLATYGSNKLNVWGDSFNGPVPKAGSISSQLAQSTYTSAAPPDPAAFTNLGDVLVPAGQTVNLPTGNYTASSLTIQDGGKLVITAPTDPLATQYDGAVIHVTGDSITPINIAGSGIENNFGTQNLQIFYNGAQNVSITMGSNFNKFNGLLYAPNANVTLNMSGQEFNGSIASDKLTVKGYGSVKFNPASVGAGAAPTSILENNTKNNLFYSAQSPKGQSFNYKILTWYEPSINP